MLMPNVERFMTRGPYSIGSTEDLAHAKHLMEQHRIRHLPVIDGGELVGILADCDIDVVAAVPGVDLARVEVARVMAPPLHVWAETPIDEVSTMMAERRRDCVAVRGGHGVEGIFTATDALTALAEIVRRATA